MHFFFRRLLVDDIKRILGSPFDRRKFLKRMGAAGLGVAAVTLLDGGGTGLGLVRRASAAHAVAGSASFPGIPGKNIEEIVLNFALTLEILEADLYRQALNQACGLPIAMDLFDDPFAYEQSVPDGALSSGQAQAGFNYLVEFAYVEAAHRDFLQAVLSSLHAPTVTANANGYAFPNGLGNDIAALLGDILPLEETGVRAYLGALPFLVKSKVYVTAAGSIFSTEARHSAAIARILGQDPGPTKMAGDLQVTPVYPSENTFEYFLPPATVLTAAQVYFVS
jgi:hypothetical protein